MGLNDIEPAPSPQFFERYYLGLPAWGFPGWTGCYFPPPRGSQTRLSQYASVFNTVEGNTTFYRIPDASQAQRWSKAVDHNFRFSFKLPRTLTHEGRPDQRDLRMFFSAMAQLEDKLGPFLVQYPATVGPDDLPLVDALLAQLPEAHDYVLELRHAEFFTRPACVEPLLTKYGAGRVMFDSRPIYQGDSAHPEVLAARHKKPDVPLLDHTYNGIAYARVVLHPDETQNGVWINEWVDRCARYLADGHQVYFMMHCPNNQHCPRFAQQFHNELGKRVSSLAKLPSWPMPQQTALF